MWRYAHVLGIVCNTLTQCLSVTVCICVCICCPVQLDRLVVWTSFLSIKACSHHQLCSFKQHWRSHPQDREDQTCMQVGGWVSSPNSAHASYCLSVPEFTTREVFCWTAEHRSSVISVHVCKFLSVVSMCCNGVTPQTSYKSSMIIPTAFFLPMYALQQLSHSLLSQHIHYRQTYLQTASLSYEPNS